jgi:hypothetical protein
MRRDAYIRGTRAERPMAVLPLPLLLACILSWGLIFYALSILF